MVYCSFGIDVHKTRCFNWISVGYFDEYIWLRKQGSSDWEMCFESYSKKDLKPNEIHPPRTEEGETGEDVLT
jgi:hypothetical protein